MNTKLQAILLTSIGGALLALAQVPDPATTVPRTPTTVATSPDAPTQDGFIMLGGQVYQIRNGQATPLQRDVYLKISPTGITGFDGRPLELPSGFMFTTDGRMIATPSGVTGLPEGTPGTTTRKAPETAPATGTGAGPRR